MKEISCAVLGEADCRTEEGGGCSRQRDQPGQSPGTGVCLEGIHRRPVNEVRTK